MKQDYSLQPLSRSGRARRPIEIAMTPMIDVIFLLLVFFLATSSFELVEKLMPSNTSKIAEQQSQSGVAAEDQQDPSDDALEQIIVKLQAQGNQTGVELNGAILPNFDTLEVRLQTIGRIRADVPVIIDPEPEIEAAEVVRAYDWARQAGLDRVYLATRAP